jgi:Holliday junction resolvasome RuvABC DNA-binding subunit
MSNREGQAVIKVLDKLEQEVETRRADGRPVEEAQGAVRGCRIALFALGWSEDEIEEAVGRALSSRTKN